MSEEKLTVTISNKKGVLGDATWCVDGTRISVSQLASVLDDGGLARLASYYPHLLKEGFVTMQSNARTRSDVEEASQPTQTDEVAQYFGEKKTEKEIEDG